MDVTHTIYLARSVLNAAAFHAFTALEHPGEEVGFDLSSGEQLTETEIELLSQALDQIEVSVGIALSQYRALISVDEAGLDIGE